MQSNAKPRLAAAAGLAKHSQGNEHSDECRKAGARYADPASPAAQDAQGQAVDTLQECQHII